MLTGTHSLTEQDQKDATLWFEHLARLVFAPNCPMDLFGAHRPLLNERVQTFLVVQALSSLPDAPMPDPDDLDKITELILVLRGMIKHKLNAA